jgi:hypothetical protein
MGASRLPFSGRIGGRTFLFCGNICEEGAMDMNLLSEHWYCFPDRKLEKYYYNQIYYVIW